MIKNYKKVKALIEAFVSENLEDNKEVLSYLERLKDENPERIENAQNLELLASAIIYVYLREHRLNGRGGITTKDVAGFFGIKASAITQKVFDVEFWINGGEMMLRRAEPYTFYDKDRFKVNEMYWDFLESGEAEDIKKSIKILKNIIKKDPDFFDPYVTLHEYYLEDEEKHKAVQILQEGYRRAIDLIMLDGRFPDELPWLALENRHIIRMLFNFANFLWMVEEKKEAMNIFQLLLHSNSDDNIGARYAIVAILEGYESIYEYEAQFETDGGMGLDAMAVEKWFWDKAPKHKDAIGWWIDEVEN